MPTGHLCRVWHGQWCTLVTSSHPWSLGSFFVLHRTAPAHPSYILGLYSFSVWELNMVFTSCDGWLTFLGLWYKRLDAQMNVETSTLQEIYTFFYYLSTDGSDVRRSAVHVLL